MKLFYLSSKMREIILHIIICGFGTIAQSLAKIWVSSSDDLYAKYGIKPRVVGIIDSKGGVVESSGLDHNRLS